MFALVLLFLAVGSFLPAKASTVSDVRGWCGYGGTYQTGCQPMVQKNFPVPSQHSTQLFYDALNAGSYYATMCFYSRGLMPEVQLSSGTWNAKQRDLCHSLALQVYHDNSLAVVQNLEQKVLDANSFSGKMAVCTKGISFGITNFNWVTRYLPCFIKTAFWPENIGSVIDDTKDTKTHKTIPGLRTLALDRVPFAYIVSGAVVVKNFVTAYISTSHPCVTGTNSGVVAGSFAIPGTTNHFAVKLPCAPTGNIKALRGFLVDFLWLGTALGLWSIAVRSVKF